MAKIKIATRQPDEVFSVHRMQLSIVDLLQTD